MRDVVQKWQRISGADGRRQQVVDRLTSEVALLFLRMRVAATEYLGRGRHSAGQRSILKEVRADGPRTVPEMARRRAVSRQHVQNLVDELLSEGLLRSDSHPEDRRTRSIALTQRGAAFLASLDRREAELMEFIAKGITARRLQDAAAVLRVLRQRLESGDWRRIVERQPPVGRRGK